MSELKQFPLVSVVLTTYNGEKFLAQQIDSLLKQSYSNIEIIAVDDCSKDNSVAILNAFAAEHKNIKIYVNETNLGFIKNFEKGCRLAQGEFIAFCDQDDYWLENKIQRLIESIGDYPMIYCDSKVCDENLNVIASNISNRVHYTSLDNCLQLAVFCRINGHAILFTKSLFAAADPFLEVIPHDWWISYNALLNGGIKYLDESLTLYRQHSTNACGVVGGKSKKDRLSKGQHKKVEIDKIRTRINDFYQKCPADRVKEKNVLATLVKCYSNFTLLNNFKRMLLFLKYHQTFLLVKGKSLGRQYLFCLKMFVMIK